MIVALENSGTPITADVIKTKLLQEIQVPSVDSALATSEVSTFNDSDQDQWFFDSGASVHMTWNHNLKENMKHSVGTLIAANEGIIKVTATGSTVLKPHCQQEAIPVKEVQLLPELGANLLSVSQIVKQGHTVIFTNDGCRVVDTDGDFIATGIHDNNLFKLEQHRQDTESALAFSSSESLEVWHRRLDHLNVNSIRRLADGLVDGVKINSGNHGNCKSSSHSFQIPHVTSLDSMKALPLVEINLEGNPLKDRIKDQTVYISEIRKRLPKIIKLDNMDLPPPIGFDVPEDDHKLPSAKASFLCDTAGADIVRQFLEQYFVIYDSDNRQPLLEAYHEHAMISMTVFNSPSQGSQQRLQTYLNFNRNLNQKRDLDTRCRTLKMGRLPVVTFLSELPKTKHDPLTFVVDLTLFTPQLILLTVTGVFKERKVAVINEPYRSFQRSLVIVPSGSGFCIRNEMIHINNATRIQEDKAFKDPASSGFQAPATAAPVATVPIPVAPVVPPVVDDNTKLQMVQAMAAHSNMNLEWSRKCLEETNWDFERAGFAFTELHKQNRIPPEAFVKN
ncbi:nuclear RNA export factor 1 [Aedes albopictus]|uniref:Nuclear RNA export factor 1 n=1 Tax=Aedes albopictus TaxID=7160 RepID=A0ABM1XRJ5_AEDAL